MNTKRVFGSSGFAILAFTLAASSYAADPSAVLIKGPTSSITATDFMAELARIPDADRSDFLADVKRVNTTLEQLYVTRELARQAEQMKLHETPTIEAKLRLAREKILAQERLSVLDKSLKIPDFAQRAKELYLANQDQYRFEPTVRASHILISTRQLDKEAALKKTQAVRADIVSGKISFEAAAQEFSEDASGKEMKGNLGWFEAKRVVKPFADAVFGMKPGELSQPVETRAGFHLIRLEEKKPGGVTPFETVKKKMVDQLTADYIQAARTEHMNEIKGDKGIVVNTDEIVKFSPKASAPAEKGAAEKPKQ